MYELCKCEELIQNKDLMFTRFLTLHSHIRKEINMHRTHFEAFLSARSQASTSYILIQYASMHTSLCGRHGA